MCWALQELAWASFALLRNTNTAGVLVWTNDAVLIARGELPSPASDKSPAEGLELDILGEVRLMHCFSICRLFLQPHSALACLMFVSRY